MMSTLALIALIICLWIFRHFGFPFQKSFPPGPFLPVQLLPYLPWSKYFGMSQLSLFAQLEKDYGKIFSANLGHERIVMISDFENVKRVFAKKINKRPEEIISHWRDNRFGVIFTNGDYWKQQRKVFMEVMKETAFDKGQIETSLNLVWPKVRRMIEEKGPGEKMSVEEFDLLLTQMVLGTISDPSLLGSRDPPKEMLETFNVARTLGIQWCEFETWYRYPIMRVLAPEYSGYNKTLRIMERTKAHLDHLIQLHLDQPSEDRRDFIDVYLAKLQSLSSNPLFSGSNGRQALIGTLDNILVGSDGIFLAFYTMLCTLGQHPHIQEKMRADIRNSLRDGQHLSLADRKRLVYCEAAILEVQRLCSQSGYGAPHQTEEDVPVEEFVIPKGTDVFPNMYGILHDEKYWKNPNEFRPERFIDTNGRLIHDPRLIPFELGPRMCPGRNFALDILSLLTERVVSEFNIVTHFEPQDLTHFESVALRTASILNVSAENLRKRISEKKELIGMALVLPKKFTVELKPIQNKSVGWAVNNISNQTVIK